MKKYLFKGTGGTHIGNGQQTEALSADKLSKNGARFGTCSRLSFFVFLLIGLSLLWPSQMVAQKKSLGERLTPNVAVVQYAGNIGMFSAGAGWEYGKDRWLTEVLLGYVPHYHHTQSLNTMTLRQYYSPWNIALPLPMLKKGQLKLTPLTIGMRANIVLFDGDFWTEEPHSHYGGSYYRFSTRVRFAFSAGHRLTYEFPEEWKRWGEGVEMYYEFSANELGIISAIPNRHIHSKDIFALGVGARWKF